MDFDTADLGLTVLLINAGCSPEHLGYALEALDDNGGKMIWVMLQDKVGAAVDAALVRASA